MKDQALLPFVPALDAINRPIDKPAENTTRCCSVTVNESESPDFAVAVLRASSSPKNDVMRSQKGTVDPDRLDCIRFSMDAFLLRTGFLFGLLSGLAKYASTQFTAALNCNALFVISFSR